MPVDRSQRLTSKYAQSVVDHGSLDRDPWGTLDRHLTPADVGSYKSVVHHFRDVEDKLEYESEAAHRSSLGPYYTWKTKEPMLTAEMLAEDPRKYMREGSRAIRKGLAGAITDAENTIAMQRISVRNMAPRDYAMALSSVLDPATASGATTVAKIPDRSFYDITTTPPRSIDVMAHLQGGTTKASRYLPFKQVSRTLGRGPMAYTEPYPTIVMQSALDDAERNPSSAAVFAESKTKLGPPIRIMEPRPPLGTFHPTTVEDPVVLRILKNAFDPDLLKIGPVEARDLRFAEVGFPGSNANQFFETPRQVRTRETKTERDALAEKQTAMIEDRYGFRFADSYKPKSAVATAHRSFPARGAEDKLLMERALDFQPDYTADIAERAMVTGAEFIEPLNARYEIMREIASDMSHQRDPLVIERPRTARKP